MCKLAGATYAAGVPIGTTGLPMTLAGCALCGAGTGVVLGGVCDLGAVVGTGSGCVPATDSNFGGGLLSNGGGAFFAGGGACAGGGPIGGPGIVAQGGYAHKICKGAAEKINVHLYDANCTN